MVSTVFPAPVAPTVSVLDTSDVFPVHRIYCVGKNYAAHIEEMGGSPDRQPPCFFMKPADAVTQKEEVRYPPASDNVHYEAELVIAIGKEGVNIPESSALDHVYGYAIGVDMTRRDLQLNNARDGNPWDTGKGFDESAPLSTIIPLEKSGHFESGQITLKLNGETRQQANFTDLIWKNHEIIAALSTFFRLQPGDLIFTGTPAGVGQVRPGDRIEVEISRLGKLAFSMAGKE